MQSEIIEIVTATVSCGDTLISLSNFAGKSLYKTGLDLNVVITNRMFVSKYTVVDNLRFKIVKGTF